MIWNWLKHRLGWNRGIVETWTARCGRVMVGFRCDDCGQLHGIHPVPEKKIDASRPPRD